MTRPPPRSTLFPYPPPSQSGNTTVKTFTVTVNDTEKPALTVPADITVSNDAGVCGAIVTFTPTADRKSTRLNSSHTSISYAAFSLKKKTVTVTATDPHGNAT